MKLILTILLPLTAIVLILAYVLCVAASSDDRDRERMARKWEEDK